MPDEPQVWVEGELDGCANMQRDADLLVGLQRLRARVYGWNGPWVSLGHHQSADRALLPAAPVRSVLRPTGGKAVLHGHDVTLGLASTLQHLGCQDSRRVTAMYRALAKPIIAALRGCGIEADLGENTAFVRSRGMLADCFAHVAPNDIVDARRGVKLCGCALKLTSDAVLLQASLPAGPPLVDPGRVFDRPAPVAWSEGLTRERFAEALARALSEFGV